MGKVIDAQSLGVTEFSMVDLKSFISSSVPVKHTFIHFESKRRLLKRWQSDPDPAPAFALVAIDDVLPPSMEEDDNEERDCRYEIDLAPTMSVEGFSCDEEEPLRTPELSPRHWAAPASPPPSMHIDSWCMSSPVPLSSLPLVRPSDSIVAMLPCSLQRSPQPRSSPHHEEFEKQLPSTFGANLNSGLTDFCRFTFTLRRADGVSLGLDVNCTDALIVQGVRPEGAVDSWNRQVRDGPTGWKALRVGDALVAVNGETDCWKMLDEIKGNQLLKIEVERRGPMDVVRSEGAVQEEALWQAAAWLPSRSSHTG